VLSETDDGSLTLRLATNEYSDEVETDAALSYAAAFGRAMAMAIVSRTFVTVRAENLKNPFACGPVMAPPQAKLSPVLCKLLVGRPVHFMDLLHENQGMFRDLLTLMMLPPDAVEEVQFLFFLLLSLLVILELTHLRTRVCDSWNS
jgi:hypothetical protein